MEDENEKDSTRGRPPAPGNSGNAPGHAHSNAGGNQGQGNQGQGQGNQGGNQGGGNAGGTQAATRPVRIYGD